MEIYLNKRLLVRSKVFENEEELHKAKFGPREENRDAERIWQLYTWDSKEKLSSVEDFTFEGDYDTIEAKLKEYKPLIPESKGKVRDDFHNQGILPPDHVLTISAYSSFIKTPLKTVKSIINHLEEAGIFCLLGTNVGPLFSHVKYKSKELEELLKNPIEVEL